MLIMHQCCSRDRIIIIIIGQRTHRVIMIIIGFPGYPPRYHHRYYRVPLLWNPPHDHHRYYRVPLLWNPPHDQLGGDSSSLSSGSLAVEPTAFSFIIGFPRCGTHRVIIGQRTHRVNHQSNRMMIIRAVAIDNGSDLQIYLHKSDCVCQLSLQCHVLTPTRRGYVRTSRTR